MVTFADDPVLKPGECRYTAYLCNTHTFQPLFKSDTNKFYVLFEDDCFREWTHQKSPKFDTPEEAEEWAKSICASYVKNENAAGRKVAMPDALDNGDVGPVVKIFDISVIDEIRKKEEEADARTVTQFDHG